MNATVGAQVDDGVESTVHSKENKVVIQPNGVEEINFETAHGILMPCGPRSGLAFWDFREEHDGWGTGLKAQPRGL